MFNSLKIPVTFLVIGICWALLTKQIISIIFTHLAPEKFNLYRGSIDLFFVVVVTFVLYIKIKKQQNKLAKSEGEYRQLFESNPNPQWIYNDETLRFVKVNNAAIEKYGYSKRKFLRMSIADIRPQVAYEKKKGHIKEYQDGLRQTGVWQHMKATGERFDVSVISYPVLFNSQHCNLMMVTDLTELFEKERKPEYLSKYGNF